MLLYKMVKLRQLPIKIFATYYLIFFAHEKNSSELATKGMSKNADSEFFDIFLLPEINRMLSRHIKGRVL